MGQNKNWRRVCVIKKLSMKFKAATLAKNL